MAAPVFQIGLNMAGAISAGAYTAGVMDFLIDALDAWYAKRAEQMRLHGNDFAQWEIPVHQVSIPVMSGASAGGMTAAISAACFYEAFEPVRRQDGSDATNKLFRSWVSDIDISALLSTADLADAGQVSSILNSSRLDELAAAALDIPDAVVRRDYVDPRLKLILTLTNLRGTPYTVEKNRQEVEAESRIFYYADQQEFEVRWDGAGPTERNAVPLDPRRPDNWNLLREAALATGAFPVMLKPRVLTRSAKDYNTRTWRMPLAKTKMVDGVCVCEEDRALKPSWDLQDSDTLQTVNVDGGVTNNNPLECARHELASREPRQPNGKIKSTAADADRAVITIAPFPSEANFNPFFTPDVSFLTILGETLNTVLTQSRFQGQSIELAENPEVFSDFVITPSLGSERSEKKYALAGGALSAFGGFLAHEFREYDYQLGRRNCQRFLEHHFILPIENPVIAAGLPQSGELRERVIKAYQAAAPDGAGGVWMRIVPLWGEHKNVPVQAMRPKIDRARLDVIVDAAADRIEAIVDTMIRGGFREFEFDAFWFLVKGHVKDKIRGYMAMDLERQELLK